MDYLEPLFLLCVLICSGALALTMFGVWNFSGQFRTKTTASFRRPPVTVLKPLCGLDENLESNLETFFRLKYPDFELLFGVEGSDDPSIPVVRRLRARFPEVRCRLIIHEGHRGINPKVSNLRAMIESGAHDVVVICDSNLEVDDDYLDRMVEQLESDERVGLVSNLVIGSGEKTLGAMLENLHMNGFVCGTIGGSQYLPGARFAVGKSMMFRRSVLDSLGGLESVANVQAEDYILCKMFQTAGYEVRLSTGAVRNVNMRNTVERFIQRHHRWAIMRSRACPQLFAFEPLTNPMALALAATLLQYHERWPLAWAVGLTMARDGLHWYRLRGLKGLSRALVLGIFKDIIILGVWGLTPFTNVVVWRDHRFRVGMGSRLYAESPMATPAMVANEEKSA